MTKNKLSVYFIFIAIFTVISGFVLIVQKSYSNLIRPSQKINTDNLLKPIAPILDVSVIQEIQNRSDAGNDQEPINFTYDSEISITPSQINNQENEASLSTEANPASEE